MFAFLCVTWGCTWMAMKAGVVTVPPAIFSGLRWATAGALMLAFRHLHGDPVRVPPRLYGRLLLVAIVAIPINATAMLYSVRYINSGLAAVINCAMTPLTLHGLSVALGHERFTWQQGRAMALGIAGVLVLFGPKVATGHLDAAEVLGSAGVMFGTLCYSVGSVLSLRMMRTLTPAQMAAMLNFVGGIILLILAVLFEPGAQAALHFDWGTAAWAGWLFLVFPASLGATTIYFFLVRDWGASRAGTYAFVSPVIAVMLGILVFGERLQSTEAAGMVLMLGAAVLALRRATP
jgi:drug/metabolite transporter (DMT)-like permease